MKVIDAIFDIAATTRITRLVIDDEITRPAREQIEDRWSGSQLAYLVTCPYCVSVWAGAAVLILPKPITRMLALSGFAIAARYVKDEYL